MDQVTLSDLTHDISPLTAIIVAAVLIFVITKKRRNKKSGPSPLNNPSYMDTSGISPHFKCSKNCIINKLCVSALPVKQSPSDQTYDYCKDPPVVERKTDREERVYATLQAQHQETGNGSLSHSNPTYDYTSIYEDPTSPSYVVCLFSREISWKCE